MQKQYSVLPRYTITRAASIYVCSPYVATYKTLRDSSDTSESMSWDFFSESDLPQHFAKGMRLLQEKLKELSDVSVVFTEDSRKQLEFMLESCIQSRKLIDTLRK
jgi:hypothetical protein